MINARERIFELLHLLTSTGSLQLTANVSLLGPGFARTPGEPEVVVELSGPDASLLTERNGELLYAIEHLAAKMLRLEPEEHDRISFDVGGYKATRNRKLQHAAETAIAQVRATQMAYTFPPMTSRERRMLHLSLAQSGLHSASTGEGPGRSVVLYPTEITRPASATETLGVSGHANH